MFEILHYPSSSVQTLEWWKWPLAIAFRTPTVVVKFSSKKLKTSASTKPDPMHVRVLQTFSVGLKSSEYGCCGSKPAVPQHLCGSPVPVVDQSLSQAQINWLLPQMLNPCCMRNRPSLFDLPLCSRPRESVSHLFE
jgi:hypothetical protein